MGRFLRRKLLEQIRTIHNLAWECDDMMSQEGLFKLQETIDQLVVDLANQGELVLNQLPNGYIKGIEIPVA